MSDKKKFLLLLPLWAIGCSSADSASPEAVSPACSCGAELEGLRSRQNDDLKRTAEIFKKFVEKMVLLEERIADLEEARANSRLNNPLGPSSEPQDKEP